MRENNCSIITNFRDLIRGWNHVKNRKKCFNKNDTHVRLSELHNYTKNGMKIFYLLRIYTQMMPDIK